MKTPSLKSRDGNILKSYKREISLQTKSIKDKTKYSRTEKHQSDYLDIFDIDVEEYLKGEEWES